MRNIILLILFVVLSNQINAQKRNYHDAEMIANSFLTDKIQSSRVPSLKRVVNNFDTSAEQNTAEENVAFYIFTDSILGSFVIVSGDERMNDVLAFSKNGEWNNENIPFALKDLLSHYEKQFALLQKGEVARNNEPSFIDIPNISPLIKSTWSQGAPYNDLCPNECPSGCVATAMSQVMKFHEYPKQGNGNFSYVSRTKNYNCSYNFSNATFNWDNIKNSYSSQGFNQTTDKNDIANLTYACGVSVAMDYTPGGSGAYMVDVPYALIRFFQYNKNVTYRYRPYHTNEEWYSMLCNEISNGRPVIYGGVDDNYGGHAFVIDGCDSITEKFHINWGWGGENDGYFALDALNPSVYKFTSYQDMILNVSPYEVGLHDDIFYATSFKASSIEIGKTATFTLNEVYNYSNTSSYVVRGAKFYGQIGVGLFDEDFNYIASLDSDTVNGLNCYYGYEKIAFSVKITKTLFQKEGKYKIAPYVKGRNSKLPTRIRTLNGATDYILVHVDENDIIGDDDDDDETEETQVWFESFEKVSIPNNWIQNINQGNGMWAVRSVIVPSQSKPSASHGKCYVYLKYENSVSNFYNNRNVTRLITDYISLLPDSTYNVSFATRVSIDGDSIIPQNIIALYYEKDGVWECMGKYDVQNRADWCEFSAQIKGVGKTRLAIEGSVEKNSSLLLDRISINTCKTLLGIIENNDSENIVTSIYNINGRKIPLKDGGVEQTLLNLPKGLYIIKYKNFKTQIILHQ